MRLTAICLAALMLSSAATLDAQTRRRTPARRPAPAKPAALTKAPATLTCPAELGVGVTTKRPFCDVLSGRDPKEGVLVTIPPHTGPATLSFDLHARHTYSEQQTRSGAGFADYTAVVAALVPETTEVLARAAVHASFRAPSDLFDRVGGGAGPGGVKAVAPLGAEPITIAVPADVTRISLLGERLTVENIDGRSVFTSPGRPVAVVSNMTVEYRPGPAPRKPAPRR
jgi:hypothetical protein